MLVQAAEELQSSVPFWHSLTSAQVKPLPEKPVLQVQVNDPIVLLQVADALQPPLLIWHSLMSAQVKPLPVKPVPQVQRNDPTVLAQVAYTLQPPLLVWHSSISAQVTPLPEKPVLQVQLKDSPVLVQVAWGSQLFAVEFAQKSYPMQPVCVTPLLQTHWKLPIEFWQVEMVMLQPPLLVWHSLISAQVTPLPENPVLQVQVNDPTVLAQVAWGSQLSVPRAHSLMSVQITPFPV